MITEDNSKIENLMTEKGNEEPLFHVVLPYKRTWFYKFKTYFKKIVFGNSTKALPAPKQ